MEAARCKTGMGQGRACSAREVAQEHEKDKVVGLAVEDVQDHSQAAAARCTPHMGQEEADREDA